jgi:enoyl-CoA hydratase/carnithine racemase
MDSYLRKSDRDIERLSDRSTVETSKREEVQCYEAAPMVRVVQIDRPTSKNALNLAVKDRVADLMDELDRDPGVRAIIITGRGADFAAGTDISEMAGLSPTDHTLKVTDRMFTAIRQCGTPVIAAVEGYALGGGCELALSCDLVVAGASSRFGQPEIRVGVMPGAGATQRMVRVIGKFRTLRLLLTGEQFDGVEALAMGLVSEVTADGSALSRAVEVAETITTMPQLAVRGILEVVEAGADAPLATALLLERKAFQLLFDSEDQAEGMRAFVEKRLPEFRGR